MSIRSDYILHTAISSLLVVALAKLLPITISAIIVMIIGAGKEYIWDYKLHKGTPEKNDLIADVIGIAIGILITIL